FDKKVYNLYLKSTRTKLGQPYKCRKNFDDLDEKDKTNIKKLSTIFLTLPHLMVPEYFEAPFEVRRGKYYGIDFYSTMKAIGDYSKYIKTLELRPPDEQIDYIKQSYIFIYNFCKTKKIPLRDYPYYKSVAISDCLGHIKDHKVSPYVMFSFPELYTVVSNVDSDIFKLFFGDMDID